MAKAENGKTVSVHYRGTLEDGTEFDNSHDRGETLNFTLGAGAMIPGFEAGVVGMQVGETKTIQVSPSQGYGERVNEAVRDVSKDNFPEDFEFVEDATVQGQAPNGQPIIAKIIKENTETVTLDFNHPLAGKQLSFEVEMVNISE